MDSEKVACLYIEKKVTERNIVIYKLSAIYPLLVKFLGKGILSWRLDNIAFSISEL